MGDLCPTHGTLTIHMNLHAPSYTFRKLRSPRPLEELVQQPFTKLYGPPPSKPSSEHPFSQDFVDSNPELAAPTPQLKRLLEADAKAANIIYDAAHHAYYQELHAYMGAGLAARSGRLQALLNRGDTDSFWWLFWELVEGSIVHFTSSEYLADYASYLGRGSNLL